MAILTTKSFVDPLCNHEKTDTIFTTCVKYSFETETLVLICCLCLHFIALGTSSTNTNKSLSWATTTDLMVSSSKFFFPKVLTKVIVLSACINQSCCHLKYIISYISSIDLCKNIGGNTVNNISV